MNFQNLKVSIGAGLLAGLVCAATASAQTAGGCETKVQMPTAANAAKTAPGPAHAAAKTAFDEQMQQLQSDPAVQAQMAQSRAAFAAAAASPELAAQRAEFDRQMKELKSDPAVQAQIAQARKQFQELANDPTVEQQRAAMKKQLDAAQSSPDLVKQRVQVSDPCHAK
jgi:hypothetical protein